MSETVYADLDRTLLDRRGRVVPATLATVDLADAHGWRVVLLTGRSRWAAVPIAQALGIRDVICELGAVVRVDGADVRTLPTPGAVPRDALLRAVADPAVEEHEPGTPRVAGIVLRSAIPAVSLSSRLQRAGLGGWHAVDNGPSHLAVRDGAPGRVVHLLPRGVDKAAGVRAHQRLLGLAPSRCCVVGDSPADLACASVVRRTVLVRSDDPEAARDAAARGIATTVHEGGPGALEALGALVAERDGTGDAAGGSAGRGAVGPSPANEQRGRSAP